MNTISKLVQSYPFHLSLLRYFTTTSRTQTSRLDVLTPTNLLSSHFKSGRVSDAQKLFDEMPDRNIVSWSIAIHGYAINGLHVKSMNMFSRMRNTGLVPNSFTVVGVLVSAAGLGVLELGRYVHGVVVKSGLNSELIVATAMLNMYAKCGDVLDCYKVFEELNCLDLVPCNAVIAGFVANGLHSESFELFKKFRKGGLVPNTSTMLTLMRSCIGLGFMMLAESVHGLIIKLGLGLDCPVNNAVIGMYSSFLHITAAGKAFQEMECKDIISWSTMMGLLVDLEDAPGALRLYTEMRSNGVNVDAVVIVHLILASAVLGHVNMGSGIHAQAIVRGFMSQLPIANSLISMYLKCGDLDLSRTVFDQTADKSPVTWTAMISGLTKNGHSKAALDLMIKARWEKNYSLDSVSLLCCIIACGEIAALELCQQLHCHAFKTGYSHHTLTSNSLITAYSRCGNVNLAHIVFKDMGSLRNVASWNAIISGYGINGHGEISVRLYHDMKENEDPDSTTYLAVLNACSHSGLVADGVKIFNQMIQDKEVNPNQEHFGCVIDLLVRAGHLDNASRLAAKFPAELSPNVWKTLLGGCAVHGNLQLAEHAAKNVLEQESGEEVLLLSNAYASVGRFEDAEALRLSIQEKEFIKDPGLSIVKGMHYDCG
ncbi:Pentatricopeptide repeat-containing protein At4g13650 [Linum perenne]